MSAPDASNAELWMSGPLLCDTGFPITPSTSVSDVCMSNVSSVGEMAPHGRACDRKR